MNKSIEAIFPLTPMQQGMLFHSIIDENQTAYFQQVHCCFEGKADPDIIKQAWKVLLQRHEVLRSSFYWELQKESMQVIMQHAEVPVTVMDWTDKNETDKQHAMEELLATDRKKTFKLDQAPLMRLMVVQLDTVHFDLIWSHHHLLVDGWSTGIIFQEFQQIYQSLVTGDTPKLPVVRPYKNYISWLSSLDEEKAKKFWAGYLKGLSGATPLPEDLKDTGTTPVETAYHIPYTLTDDIKRFARESEITVNVLLLSCWALLLSRYTASDDISFGITVAGRHPDLPGIESKVGLFINSVPVRIGVNSNERLSAWLKQVQQNLHSVQEFGYSSLSEIKRCSQLPATSPLFESLFVFENYPVSAMQAQAFGGIKLKKAVIHERTNYPLTLVVEPGEDEFVLRALFQPGRIPEKNMQQILHSLVQLITHVVAAGKFAHQTFIGNIPMVDELTRKKIAYEWNHTEFEYNKQQCIHTLFEIQANKTPNNIAITGSRGALSYLQTNIAANRIANRLIKKGAGKNKYIGVYFSRGIEMIPALLGILKTGAAYVPIDLSNPVNRVAHIIASLNIDLIITQHKHSEYLLKTDAITAKRLILLDEFAEIILPEDERLDTICDNEVNPDVVVSADDEAYVIFTSGSTGTPKGVTVTHKPVINLIEWVNNKFNITASDRVLFITSLSFDLSVYDIFGFLAAGASVRVVADDAIREPAELVKILTAEPITFWDSAPAALNQLVPFLPEFKVESKLRLIFQSGDWIPINLPDRIRQTFPLVEFVSLGGATEATVWSNYFVVDHINPKWKSIPYGKPIQNARYYVLDHALNVCAIGIPGNLYIGGDCLFSHYANSPRLTAQKLIPDPFSTAPGSRLYDTGDMARFYPDGNIEFLGRKDKQVKVRGYRIELGEIETALSRYKTVVSAIAVLKTDSSGQKQIIAYVIQNGVHTSVADFKEWLRAYLPEYMLPANIVHLPIFPVTANGKLDINALPMPETDPGSFANTRKQLNMVEDLLWQNWTELLGKAPADIRSDFFESGGHSLLATRLIARLRIPLAIEIPVQSVFDHPVLEDLAKNITQLLAKKSIVNKPEWEKVTPTDYLDLSFAQERLWFLYLLKPGSAFYNVPLTVKLKGELNIKALQGAVNSLVARHDILRTSYHLIDGKGKQKVHDAIAVPLLFLDRSATNDPESEALQNLNDQGKLPFDLSSGQVLRGIIVKTEDDEHYFQLTFHHIVSDGWSIGIIAQEVGEFYRNHLEKITPKTIPLNYQYADFSVWQRQLFESGGLGGQISYWRDKLEDFAILKLPASPHCCATQTGSNVFRAILETKEADAVKSLAVTNGCTVFMALLSIFNATLHLITHQEDIVIGTDIACRTDVNTENLIGFFVNQIVLRSDLAGNPSFKSMLKQARKVTLDAYQNQDLPFEKLVQYLNPERHEGQMPFFQVKLVLQNNLAAELDLPELQAEPVNVATEASKYDLLVTFEEVKNFTVNMEYNRALYDEQLIARWWGYFKRIISLVTDRTDITLSELKKSIMETSSGNTDQIKRREGLLKLSALRNAERN
ncbi:non-ribosomal peptide synthetase [Mucilaginibacter phyllosphaerae]|uniref:Amino acid adenylation domain-containing protein n=1 Tax=Mucilaginibacter phyllosphaerae TaxID=1812349 RepID=A0A4Y8AFU2_9SPHI|nr:non-ribosomal peptide synthetase [Mucilaginibacter phyllosphaerae]MBB3968720.1 amino acid adenylation domain-containing protein [Mucilaginibacter phyllosphaerae]TEW67644.1 amino acid adenylation domain-containing protein [Mucilaginibacter phyllosphaerae]GGH14296.1 hypothetical protein GCM10007352_22300 [Mucilaginibacter phyllosphaerae]